MQIERRWDAEYIRNRKNPLNFCKMQEFKGFFCFLRIRDKFICHIRLPVGIMLYANLACNIF